MRKVLYFFSVTVYSRLADNLMSNVIVSASHLPVGVLRLQMNGIPFMWVLGIKLMPPDLLTYLSSPSRLLIAVYPYSES